MFQPAVGRHQSHEQAGEVAVGRRLRSRTGRSYPSAGRTPTPAMSKRLGQPALDLVAVFGGQRVAHAAGHCPGRMHALAAQQPDHLLAELAQADAAAGHAGVRLDQAHDVALWRDRNPCPAADRARSGGRSSTRGSAPTGPSSSAGAASPRAAGCARPGSASPALAEARMWLTGQMPQTRAVMPGISQKLRPTQNFSKPRNSTTWKRASATLPSSPSMSVILAWPSMRVTGSIVTVRVISTSLAKLPHLVFQHHRLAGQQRADRGPDPVRGQVDSRE